MKKFSFKAVALAAGLVVGGSAFATVDLEATTDQSVKYATEATISATGTGTALTDVAAHDATVTTGVVLANTDVKYVRFTLSSGTFTADPAATAAANAGLVLVQGGTGESFAIFKLTATGATTSANALTLAPAGLSVKDKAAVTLTYGLYDTQSAAANQTAGSSLKTATGNYLAFAKAVDTTIAKQTVVADVDAAISFTRFTTATAVTATSNKTAILANVTVATTAAGALGVGGAAATAATVFGASNVVSATGDFSAAKNADGTYTGDALTRVYISTGNDCTTVSAKNATALTSTTATFAALTAAELLADGTRFLCYTVEGTSEIPAATYTAAIDYAAAAGHTATDIAATAAGEVTRNGVTLVAPLVNQPAGWYSRLVLANTGALARSYVVTATSETGTTAVLSGDAAAGTIAPNTTKVIDLASLATITGGAPRTTLKVVVNGPDSAISGLYQIANGTTGMLSNYTLVKK